MKFGRLDFRLRATEARWEVGVTVVRSEDFLELHVGLGARRLQVWWYRA